MQMVDIKKIAYHWNYKYPVDYWWRSKHKIAFNSSIHRASNFWDQLFEFYEEKFYEDDVKDEYKPNQNDYLKINEIAIERIEEGIELALKELQKFKEEYGSIEGN